MDIKIKYLNNDEIILRYYSESDNNFIVKKGIPIYYSF